VVTVTDGRGGTTTGTFVEQVGAPSTVGLAPVITATAQSATSVDGGGTVVLDVAATDPKGQALTFAWSATGGTLGAATTTAGTSEVVWTAPSITGTFTLTATVTDAAGLATAQVFNVSAIGATTSCAVPGDGRDNCGQSSSESCCTSLLVVGNASASFSRTYDAVSYTDPQYKAQISDFRLDKYEITVGRFRKFVDAIVGGWTPPAGSGKHTHLHGGNGLAANSGGFEAGWDAAWNTSANFPTDRARLEGGEYLRHLNCANYATWTPTPGSNETKPITCIDWYEAEAFCIWDGGFLPSAAEWNYAAAGGTAQRRFPWGNTSPGANADLAVYGCFFGGSGTCNGAANLPPVGSVPAGNGLWGHADLAGSVWEFNLDWLTWPYGATTCIDCADLAPTGNRVVRGGSWFHGNPDQLLASYVLGLSPTDRYDTIGSARCARTP
jgi:formylglycine-generating enzyme required for sulfatase activity